MIDIDLGKYARMRQKGYISLSKAGDNILLTVRKFDPDSLDELESEVQYFTLVELREWRKGKADELAKVDAFIAEVKLIA